MVAEAAATAMATATAEATMAVAAEATMAVAAEVVAEAVVAILRHAWWLTQGLGHPAAAAAWCHPPRVWA